MERKYQSTIYKGAILGITTYAALTLSGCFSGSTYNKNDNPCAGLQTRDRQHCLLVNGLLGKITPSFGKGITTD